MAEDKNAFTQQQTVTYDEDCSMCKVASGTFMAGLGVYQATQVQWRTIGARDKVFSFLALGVVFGLSGLSFNAAYEIQTGVKRPDIQMRPSYTARYTSLYADYKSLQ